MFAELFMDFTRKNLENSDSQWIITIYQAISIHRDGNSDNFHSLNFSPLFLQWEGEIDGQLVKLDNWLSLWNIQDISRIYPSQGTQATLTQETKKVWNSSTQAKLEEQLEEQHRQGAAVQPYPVLT